MVLAKSLAVTVFATPGTPSISECPLAKMDRINNSIMSCWPMITLPNSVLIFPTASLKLTKVYSSIEFQWIFLWFVFLHIMI